jgi:antitoxin FitA
MFIREVLSMATLTIRKLPDETHRALKSLAMQHGRSAEAEVRHIIEQAVHPEPRVKISSILKEIRDTFGGVELDIQRDKTPARFATFE